MIGLSADEARRAALWAQGLLGGTVVPKSEVGRERAVGDMLEHLGAVQLDTISVLARSHELVAYARLGAIGRTAVESAYWNGDSAFEYWSHAACILPMSEWPWFAFRRRHYTRRGERWHGVPAKALQGILQRLRDEGPLTTKDLGGAKKSGYWWDWSEAKIAMEWLLDIGEVVVAQRTGWRRVYDLPERVVPATLRQQRRWADADGIHGPDDGECLRRLVQLGGHSVGVGTASDIADIHRLGVTETLAHVGDTDLVEVSVRGWSQRAWASPQALEWLGSGSRARSRTTLLSPFDSLIWNRDRMERLFGMEHRIEAYTPSAKRVHGYFAMPVLHGGQLVARVDPAREKATLVAKRVTLEVTRAGTPVRGAIQGTARALNEAASWVGSEIIRVDEVVPASAARSMRSAVSG
ncbi:MAG: winged helix DNA-binding domain-containing protein [Actinomycetales bacterium]|nr:winged helix DNA-binding domain-containing protein [Actinomycetales bacterium]